MGTFRTGALLLPSEVEEEINTQHSEEILWLAGECNELAEALHTSLNIWSILHEEKLRRKSIQQFWIMKKSYMALALLFGSKMVYVESAFAINRRIDTFLETEEIPLFQKLHTIDNKLLNECERIAKDRSWSLIDDIEILSRSFLEDAPGLFKNCGIPITVNVRYASVSSSLLADYGVALPIDCPDETKFASF